MLGDGQKYPVGASTSRGVRILAIEPESILVARGKQRFIINLKGRCSMMTALETRLSVADGTHAAALRQRLQAALAECRRELARGAGPERFQFLQQQARALEGGLGILSQLTED